MVFIIDNVWFIIFFRAKIIVQWIRWLDLHRRTVRPKIWIVRSWYPDQPAPLIDSVPLSNRSRADITICDHFGPSARAAGKEQIPAIPSRAEYESPADGFIISPGKVPRRSPGFIFIYRTEPIFIRRYRPCEGWVSFPVYQSRRRSKRRFLMFFSVPPLLTGTLVAFYQIVEWNCRTSIPKEYNVFASAHILQHDLLWLR